MKKSDGSNTNSGMPDGVPPPPNILDPSKAGPTYTDLEKGKKIRQKKGRNHPTDKYEAMGKKKGCGGCCGCFGVGTLLILTILVAAAVLVGYYGPLRLITQEDYEMVALKDTSTTISKAPDKPTFYIGNTVIYDAPETEVPIAIFGSEVTVSGDFLENVNLSGPKVTVTENARFAEDLEVWAAEFYDKGTDLKGDLKGRVMKSLD